jgi:DNA-binding transcriptional ArsR family regulator
MEEKHQPKLSWDWGTAYDLFVSLHVLHQPEKFGLRGLWAAGVRSRLPTAERQVLEQADKVIQVPLHWIHSLPDPKDSAAALWTLGQISPADRLHALSVKYETPAPVAFLLQEVTRRGFWDEKDVEVLRASFHGKLAPPRSKDLATILNWWCSPEEHGEKYLAALQAYQQVFFTEEETRIRPAMQKGLEVAQEMAVELDLRALLEKLSRGVTFERLSEFAELVLAPSYWSTPLVVYEPIGERRMLLLYGARPVDVSLVPGEAVPEALLLALKALGDPTRLRILRYLAGQPHTPAQLARRLRLRAPTVIHHLNALRLAGLVHLTLEVGGERRYAMRRESVAATFGILNDFLEEKGEE